MTIVNRRVYERIWTTPTRNRSRKEILLRRTVIVVIESPVGRRTESLVGRVKRNDFERVERPETVSSSGTDSETLRRQRRV